MATVINYGATVVTPITNGVNIPIPVQGGQQIAAVSVFIDPANPASFSNRVEIKGSIGVEALEGTPEILVRILRAGKEIYYGLVELENVFNDFDIINVLMVEGAPLGVQNYQLVVQNLDRFSRARVIGPIVFTATAIGG
ncbi:hypothetical protein [Paenibacillus jiagnxiensis]|uniref:hypothetical protein n=1 Tax=Paenibacillus jiagnxiensis TaxID=3228926 RepID=UPI0033B4DB00